MNNFKLVKLKNPINPAFEAYQFFEDKIQDLPVFIKKIINHDSPGTPNACYEILLPCSLQSVNDNMARHKEYISQEIIDTNWILIEKEVADSLRINYREIIHGEVNTLSNEEILNNFTEVTE